MSLLKKEFSTIEKDLFTLLISVSGVGPKLAMTTLSHIPARDLALALSEGDIPRLVAIPGIGKKHMWEIIESRRKPFESLADIKQRLPLIADPKKGVKERILKELKGDEKYYLFVFPPRR